MENSEKKLKSSLFPIYLLGFLFTLNAALPTYIYSTFLSRFSTERFVGVIYILSSIVTILAFIFIPRLLLKFGNYKTMLGFLSIEFISLISLAFLKNGLLIFIFFIISFLSVALISFNVDVFLENFSNNSSTGKIRGTFLSIANIAWIISPLITSFILTDGDYWKVFLAAAMILIPVLFILRNKFSTFKDPPYLPITIKANLRQIYEGANIRDIFIVGFLLQFFYSWMIIYTPIYLYNYMGFTWQEIGIMFSVMLLPFVLTEAPLGRIADKRWGEKEVLSVGFIVMALAIAMIPFVQSHSVVLWSAILFVSRVGAAMVEIMSETYFFKKVNSGKVNIIGAFRTMRPLAYIVSPILAIALFSFGLPLKFIFLVLSLIMFLGLHFSLNLKDTK